MKFSNEGSYNLVNSAVNFWHNFFSSVLWIAQSVVTVKQQMQEVQKLLQGIQYLCDTLACRGRVCQSTSGYINWGMKPLPRPDNYVTKIVS